MPAPATTRPSVRTRSPACIRVARAFITPSARARVDGEIGPTAPARAAATWRVRRETRGDRGRGRMLPESACRQSGRQRHAAADKPILEQPPGVGQPARQGAFLPAEFRRGFLPAPAFETTGHEGSSNLLGKPLHFLVQDRLQLAHANSGTAAAPAAWAACRSCPCLLAAMIFASGPHDRRRHTGSSPVSAFADRAARRASTRKVAWKASSASCSRCKICRQMPQTAARDAAPSRRTRPGLVLDKRWSSSPSLSVLMPACRPACGYGAAACRWLRKSCARFSSAGLTTVIVAAPRWIVWIFGGSSVGRHVPPPTSHKPMTCRRPVACN